jgi:effector-binding domain-containing protein
MKTLRKILLWILAIIAILVVIAYLLPGSYKVERSIYIKADKMLTYGLVCNLQKWHLWSAWTKEADSTVVFEFEGTDCQPGAVMRWTGERLGNGEMILSEIQPGQFLGYDLSFDKGKYTSRGSFSFEEIADSMKITWVDEGDLGYNPFARYMGLMMERMMGPDFEKGLTKLKTVSEMRCKWPRIEETSFEAQTAILIRDSAGPADYERVMGSGFGELASFVKANKITCTGYPFAIYIKWDSVTQFSVFDLGMTISGTAEGKGRVRVESIPAQKVVQAYYYGPYDKTYDAYMALDSYVKAEGLEEAGGPWEIYVTDPMTEKDTAKWETRIAFPVK